MTTKGNGGEKELFGETGDRQKCAYSSYCLCEGGAGFPPVERVERRGVFLCIPSPPSSCVSI